MSNPALRILIPPGRLTASARKDAATINFNIQLHSLGLREGVEAS
jgi:hypothetical protein